MSEAVSSDSAAGDQLRAFIERIERPADRLAYVMSRLDHCRGVSEQAMSRAFWLASQVLSTGYATAKAACQLARIADPSGFLGEIGPLGRKVPGFVYVARIDGRADRVKVGFTTDPARREQALSRLYGGRVEIVRTYVGTMLDEHAVHCDRRQYRIEGEWFRARAAQ